MRHRTLTVTDPSPLAYVEWFDISPEKDEASGMYAVTRPARRFIRHEIVPLNLVQRSCHLIPQFGKEVRLDWSSDTTLLKQRMFWLNNYSDNLAFQTLY